MQNEKIDRSTIVSEKFSERAEKDITELKIDMGIAKSEIQTLKKIIETLVTKIEFAPVKLFVYGLAASCGAGIIGAILSKVLIK